MFTPYILFVWLAVVKALDGVLLIPPPRDVRFVTAQMYVGISHDLSNSSTGLLARPMNELGSQSSMFSPCGFLASDLSLPR